MAYTFSFRKSSRSSIAHNARSYSDSDYVPENIFKDMTCLNRLGGYVLDKDGAPMPVDRVTTEKQYRTYLDKKLQHLVDAKNAKITKKNRKIKSASDKILHDKRRKNAKLHWDLIWQIGGVEDGQPDREICQDFNDALYEALKKLHPDWLFAFYEHNDEMSNHVHCTVTPIVFEDKEKEILKNFESARKAKERVDSKNQERRDNKRKARWDGREPSAKSKKQTGKSRGSYGWGATVSFDRSIKSTINPKTQEPFKGWDEWIGFIHDEATRLMEERGLERYYKNEGKRKTIDAKMLREAGDRARAYELEQKTAADERVAKHEEESYQKIDEEIADYRSEEIKSKDAEADELGAEIDTLKIDLQKLDLDKKQKETELSKLEADRKNQAREAELYQKARIEAAKEYEAYMDALILETGYGLNELVSQRGITRKSLEKDLEIVRAVENVKTKRAKWGDLEGTFISDPPGMPDYADLLIEIIKSLVYLIEFTLRLMVKMPDLYLDMKNILDPPKPDPIRQAQIRLEKQKKQQLDLFKAARENGQKQNRPAPPKDKGKNRER